MISRFDFIARRMGCGREVFTEKGVPEQVTTDVWKSVQWITQEQTGRALGHS